LKKVVHITTVHRYNDNRVFYKECSFLNQSGYDISLLIAGEDSRVENGINIIGFKKEKSRIKRYFKTSFFDVIKLALKHDASLYHFHDPELIFAGLYLKIKGKKVVYDIHENNPASILSKPYIKSNLFKKVVSGLFNIIEQISVKFFDALVTARPDITERFEHKNIITLRNFPVLPRKEDIKEIDIKKTKPAIIFVGGMSEIRGTNQLIDAFENLDEYELWLLGPISDKTIQRRVDNGCKNVKYLGFVNAKEIFSYINLADIGIVTFLPVPNHITTLATKPFEYMACGKPMIMSDFKYWRETFKESSLYVDPSNPDAIVKSVKELLNDRDKMNEMSELNKQLIETEYNWEKEVEKLFCLYNKLLGIK
jgi:glycosyltransferase involved in cell wall biosynthesis